MRYVVTQEFKTPIHRFPLGALVDEIDVDGPLTAIDWLDRGYLSHIPPAEGDVAGLRAEATELGVEFDRRWGAKRLREEIGAKKADDQAEAEKMAEAAAEAAASTDL